ncbi:MAG: hypothetical protein ACHQYP_05375 [Nitrospiria bacterium]
MKLFLRQARLLVIFILFLLLDILSCGKTSQDASSVQIPSTGQIIVIQTLPPSSGGGTQSASASISSTALPLPLFQSAAVSYTDPVSLQSFVYVIGGAYYDPQFQTDPINVNTVYRSLVKSGGALSPWITDNSVNLPSLRGHSSVIFNNSIYVIGGIGMGGFQNAIYQATINMDTSNPPVPVLSSWNLVGELPVAETGQASVVSGNTLFVIGGVESGLPDFNTCSPNCIGSQNTVFSNKIYGYDLTTTTFSTSSVTSYTMPKNLFTPAAVALPSNQIWVFGGWDGTTDSDTAYLFIVQGNTVSCFSACQPYLLPYGGISKAAGLYVQDVNQIFLLGGVSGTLSSSELIMQNVYSALATSGIPSWTSSTSLPNPVLCFSATSSGKTIYIFGGLLNSSC